MKKTLLTAATFLLLNVGTGFAAPINDLAQGQTAVGVGSDTFYIEHKINDTFTLGYQNVDRDEHGSMDDIYGQFNLNSNLRGIVGHRSFEYNDSNVYVGLAVTQPLSSQADGYASFIAGSDFKELQMGANIKLSSKADLNVNYSSYMPDYGDHKNMVGVGATFKF